MRYQSSPEFRHAGADQIGVLLVNSGTPASLATRDVRRFLCELLSDPRVVELPRALWLPILYGFILPLRPAKVARKYARIWTPEGSPLVTLSKSLRDEIKRALSQRMLAPFLIELGMLYSPPSITEALARLRDQGAQRILAVPLYPQYCGATTGAAHDRVTDELRRWRWLPEFRFVSGYSDATRYIEALRASVAEHWASHGKTQHLLISFHGIPERLVSRGDPYFGKCRQTARRLADELKLREEEWSVSFQSRFGAAEWLKPYTSDVLSGLPTRGISEVTVVCPGFAIDCLETLEEIDIENRARFAAAGGRRFLYVPALNARASHVELLAELIARHSQGWLAA